MSNCIRKLSTASLLLVDVVHLLIAQYYCIQISDANRSLRVQNFPRHLLLVLQILLVQLSIRMLLPVVLHRLNH